MRAYQKIGVFAAVISLFALQTGCQQQAKMAEKAAAPAAAKAAKVGPKIQFDSRVYDYGKVGPGQRLPGQFKFKNAGDAPLVIARVEKCCGATTELDKNEYAPGESGVLHVVYMSSRLAGTMTKRLYVDSNDKETPRAMLTIKAEIVLKVTYEPRSLRLMLNKENAGCPNITLTSTENKPFSISSFKATNNCLTAQIDPNAKATKFVLEPKANMEKLEKSRVGRISIGLAYPQPGTPPGTISIFFQAMSRFTIRPSMLVVLYNDPNQPVRRLLWVTNNYGGEFEVESAVSKEGHIKVLSQNKVGNRYQFSLEVTPPGGANVRRFSDTLAITLKGGQTLDVPCRGIYRAPTPKKAG
jgi:Protein of unknown function (DUF1573)